MIDFACVCEWVENQKGDHQQECSQEISFLRWRKRRRRSTEDIGDKSRKG
jgi:hypothetical protein